MQLKNTRSKLHISTILKIIVLILFIVVIARLAIWENQYYKSQEGKERIEPRTSGDISIDSTDVDETIITNDQKQNYIVAADQPRFLRTKPPQALSQSHSAFLTLDGTLNPVFRVKTVLLFLMDTMVVQLCKASSRILFYLKKATISSSKWVMAQNILIKSTITIPIL